MDNSKCVMETINKEKFTELIANEGYFITQTNEETDRIFASRISTPNPELWTEWTSEQKQQWQDQHQVIDEFELIDKQDI